MRRPSPARSEALLLLGWALLAAAGVQAALLSRLPASGEIPGWSILSGGDRAALNEQGLYSLYDGAAPQMKQAGIKLASQRVYKKGSKRLTADVYKFAGPAQAKAYYLKRKAEIAQGSGFGVLGGIKSEAVRAQFGRTSLCYLWQKDICCTLSVNGTAAAEKTALQDFAKNISKRLATQ